MSFQILWGEGLVSSGGCPLPGHIRLLQSFGDLIVGKYSATVWVQGDKDSRLTMVGMRVDFFEESKQEPMMAGHDITLFVTSHLVRHQAL